jgi:DHA1 family multidrug resistance protein-like MFS transporter
MNRSLLWLGAALFVWGVGESMFLLFQPVYLQELGAAPIEIGVILGAFGAAMTLTHIPAGYLSDRLGRRPMLIASWLVGALATMLMAAARELTVFVSGMLVYGLTAFVASPLNSYTTAARGKWSVARALTFVSMTFNGGAVIGPLIGGRLADAYGFRIVYFVASGLFVLSTLMVLLVTAQPRDHRDPDNPPAALLRNRKYLAFLAVFFFVAFATYVPQPLSSNYLRNEQGLSLSTIGQLISIAYLGTTLLNLVLGQLEARTGFMLGQMAVAAFAFLLWRGTTYELFAAGYFLLGGYRPMRSLGVAQVRGFVHKSQMGLAYGMAETLAAASTLLAPPLAGWLYSRDPSLMYQTALALIAVSIVITLASVPRSRVLPPDHVELMVET